jgi:glucokinase
VTIDLIVAGDIGGTNARFALARRHADGGITLSDEHRLKVADHASFETAWETFAARVGRPLPTVASVAVAGPVEGGRIALTNNPWSIMPEAARTALGLDRLLFVNDFAAVGFAVAALPPEDLPHLAGPDRPLPATGPITVMGPGTGLGVALLSRAAGAGPRIIPTEGGHVDFAPLDTLEDRILAELRRQFRRVSVERLVAGPGLGNLYAALAAIEGRAYRPLADDQLWAHVAAGNDGLARAAFERWCMILGAVCGDLALAHGARAVVLGGGIVPRIVAPLQASGFHARFRAKGRFEARMADMPIRRLAHAEPGLFGAAAAWFLGAER